VRGLALGFGLFQLENAPFGRLDLEVEIRGLDLGLEIRFAP
jgi:hypothetical protein